MIKKDCIRFKERTYIKKLKEFFTNPEFRFRFLTNHGFYNWMNDRQWLDIMWYLKFSKKMNWEKPDTFNEKMQWLKLHDRKDIYTVMVDKYEAKKYAANIIGEECIISTIGVYDRFDDIDFDELPNQFVIKCTHDSGGLIIIKDKSRMDLKKTRKKINKFLKRKYYYMHREWPYKNVKPRIIIEEYIGSDDNQSLNDYKIFCFNGRPEMVLVCSDRFENGELKKTWFDGEWNRLPLIEGGHAVDKTLKKPQKLEDMKMLAGKLSDSVPFLRTDFYEINGKVYFGEMTFYPNAGYEQFDPEEWDYLIGKKINLPFEDSVTAGGDYLISVIVPTYNSSTKMERLLKSLDEQTYKKYEVVFVDDGSTDDTIDVLNNYASKKNNVKVVLRKHGGPGLARKKGFEESMGDVVYFIDSDDWLADKNVLFKMNEIFSKDRNIGMCLANRLVYPSNETVIPFDGDKAFVKPGNYTLELFSDHLLGGNMSSKAFRKEIMKPDMFLGGFGYEDLCATYLYLDKCVMVKYADLCFHVANRDKDNKSLTRSDDYELRSLPEKAKNVITTFNRVKSLPIKSSLASFSLDIYSGMTRSRILDENVDIVKELRRIICAADLSGFYRYYSLKKRILLFCIKHGVI